MDQTSGPQEANVMVEEKRPLDDEIRATLVRVGNRVRAARKVNAISRRELSALSGVSMRYLAQLEGGEGNISIGLLQRIAHAVNLNLNQMVSEDSPSESELVARHFENASEATKIQVRHVLQLNEHQEARANRLCLIGLRGAGKSSLGALVGAHFGVPFVQLNQVIEEQAGIPVNEILALYGQDGFRKYEADALFSISQEHSQLVLEASGGIVSEQSTFSLLLNQFHTIWVKALPEEHMDRVAAQGDTRPMAGNPQAMTQLKQLLESRQPEYKKADAVLDTSTQPLQVSANQLFDLIHSRAYLAPTNAN